MRQANLVRLPDPKIRGTSGNRSFKPLEIPEVVRRFLPDLIAELGL